MWSLPAPLMYGCLSTGIIIARIPTCPCQNGRHKTGRRQNVLIRRKQEQPKLLGAAYIWNVGKFVKHLSVQQPQLTMPMCKYISFKRITILYMVDMSIIFKLDDFYIHCTKVLLYKMRRKMINLYRITFVRYLTDNPSKQIINAQPQNCKARRV